MQTKTLLLLSLCLYFTTETRAQELPFYQNGASQIVYTWQGNGTLAETSAGQPYDGAEHFRFDYNFNGWWAGFGLGAGTLNLQPYTHLRVAYRGLGTSGEHLYVSLNSASGHGSALADVGAAAAAYQVVDIPIWKIVGDSLVNLSEVTELAFSVSGVPASSGTVFLDALTFVSHTSPPVDVLYKGGVSRITGTWGTPAVQETSGNAPFEGGQHLAYANFNFNGNYWAGLGLNFNNWGAGAPLDFSQHSHLKFAWRGLAPGYNLRIRLVSGANSTDWLTVGQGAATDYQTAEVPLSALTATSGISLHAVTEISFGIENGTSDGSGSLFLDALELTGTPATGGAGVLAKSRAAGMGIGVNLSNWLEAFWLLPNDYPRPAEYTKSDIALLAAMGWKTLRMPVIFERIANPDPPYNFPASHPALALADSVVAWTEALGLKLIIDNHHGYDLTDANRAAETPRKCAVWRQIMQRYGALDPERVFFELYNEPRNGISNANFRKIALSILDTLRAHDPLMHTLIVGANNWNSAFALAATVPYPDTNLIYTFHNYQPWDFCGQGLSFIDPPIPVGVPFPNPGDVNALWNTYRAVKNWSDLYDVPVFLGEFAASAYAGPADRCAWLALHKTILDSLRFPAAYWDIKHADSYGWFKSGVLHPDSADLCLVNALGLMTGTVNTGLEPGGAALPVRLFPNPFRDWVTLALPAFETAVQVSVFGPDGRLIDHFTGTGESGVLRLDLGRYPDGLYFVRVQGRRQAVVLRAVRG